MKYTYLREILTAQWMVEPITAAAYQQAFRGLLMGLQIEKDDVPVSYYQDVDSPVKGHDREDLPSGKAINVVSLNGIMTKEDGACHDGTRTLANILLNEDKKDFVIGHVISINSGGGAANSVAVLAEAIRNCTKPVVAFVDGLMASAAMYAGSYCPYIIADSEDDRIGCIGTMIEIQDYPQRAQSADGLITMRIYATQSTEKNLEYEEALKGNIELIRSNLLDPVNEKFLNAMRENRPNVTEEQLKGLTYFAKDVVGTLIDEIGHIGRAFEKVKELAGMNAGAHDEKSNKPNNTMKFDLINQIEGCEAVETTEGVAQMSEQQLSSIEAKLSEQKQAVTEKDSAIESVKTDLTKAQETITTLNDSLTKANARIEELEHTIENDDEKIIDKHHNGRQTDAEGSDYECNDPMESCLEHIKKFNN